MEKIGGILRPVPSGKKKGSERGDLLQFFADEINRGRRGTKFAPVTIKRVAFLVKGLSVPDLYYLSSVCKEAERSGFGFSKKFFYELKPRKS